MKPYLVHRKARKEPILAGHSRQNSVDCLLFLDSRLRKHVFSYSNRSAALATPPDGGGGAVQEFNSTLTLSDKEA